MPFQRALVLACLVLWGCDAGQMAALTPMAPAKPTAYPVATESDPCPNTVVGSQEPDPLVLLAPAPGAKRWSAFGGGDDAKGLAFQWWQGKATWLTASGQLLQASQGPTPPDEVGPSLATAQGLALNPLDGSLWTADAAPGSLKRRTQVAGPWEEVPTPAGASPLPEALLQNWKPQALAFEANGGLWLQAGAKGAIWRRSPEGAWAQMAPAGLVVQRLLPLKAGRMLALGGGMAQELEGGRVESSAWAGRLPAEALVASNGEGGLLWVEAGNQPSAWNLREAKASGGEAQPLLLSLPVSQGGGYTLLCSGEPTKVLPLKEQALALTVNAGKAYVLSTKAVLEVPLKP